MEEIVGCGLEDVDALNVSLNLEFPQLFMFLEANISTKYETILPVFEV